MPKLTDSDKKGLNKLLADFEQKLQQDLGTTSVGTVTPEQIEKLRLAQENALRYKELKSFLESMIQSYTSNIALVHDAAKQYVEDHNNKGLDIVIGKNSKAIAEAKSSFSGEIQSVKDQNAVWFKNLNEVITKQVAGLRSYTSNGLDSVSAR